MKSKSALGQAALTLHGPPGVHGVAVLQLVEDMADATDPGSVKRPIHILHQDV